MSEENGRLVIVYTSGGLKLLGRVSGDISGQKPVNLEHVWQINQMMAPLPTGEGISQMTILMPPPGAKAAVKKLTVVPEVWLYPEEAGCEQHIKELIKQVEESAQQERAKASGIALARPGQIRVPPPR